MKFETAQNPHDPDAEANPEGVPRLPPDAGDESFERQGERGGAGGGTSRFWRSGTVKTV